MLEGTVDPVPAGVALLLPGPDTPLPAELTENSLERNTQTQSVPDRML